MVDETDLIRSYVEALNFADGARAERIAISCLENGMSIETLYGDVLAPSLWQVGQRWETGSISVADEGIATAITERVMSRAFAHVPISDAHTGRVMLAAVAGQRHCLGLRMLSDVLLLDGFEVIFLGNNIPGDALLGAIEFRQPDLVALSFTIDSATLSVGSVLADLSNTFPDLPLALGGQAIADNYPLSGRLVVSNDLRAIGGIAQNLIDTA